MPPFPNRSGIAPLALPLRRHLAAAPSHASREPATRRTGAPGALSCVALPGWLLACLLATLPFAPAEARESDLQQAIDVSADRSEYDERSGTQTLIGNVEISQGTMRITAERIEIHLKESKLARIEGSGAPIRFEQENENGEPVRGEAREIDYDATSGTLVLSGAATLSRPGQTLTSERIVFDASTQKVSAEGGPDKDGGPGGRVSIRIDPPSVDDAR